MPLMRYAYFLDLAQVILSVAGDWCYNNDVGILFMLKFLFKEEKTLQTIVINENGKYILCRKNSQVAFFT